jgi:hypothetical protein
MGKKGALVLMAALALAVVGCKKEKNLLVCGRVRGREKLLRRIIGRGRRSMFTGPLHGVCLRLYPDGGELLKGK